MSASSTGSTPRQERISSFGTTMRVSKLASGPYTLAHKLPPPKPDHSYARMPDKSKGKLTLYLWRWRMWFEGTFALTVMETWERWVVLAFFAILVSLLATFLVVFLPRHLARMQKRAVYYIWGKLDSALPGGGHEDKWLANFTAREP